MNMSASPTIDLRDGSSLFDMGKLWTVERTKFERSGIFAEAKTK